MKQGKFWKYKLTKKEAEKCLMSLNLEILWFLYDS